MSTLSMYPVSCIPSRRHCHVDHVISTLSCRPCPVDAGLCLVSVELTNHCCHMRSHRNLSYFFCHICTVHYLIHCNNYLSKTPLRIPLLLIPYILRIYSLSCLIDDLFIYLLIFLKNCKKTVTK